MKKNLLLLSLAFCLTVNAQYTKLMDFNTTIGYQPYGDVISDGTYLYGMTQAGGNDNDGTIFKIKPDGSNFTSFYVFDQNDGMNPRGSLVYDGTFLYGMTMYGGVSGNFGVAFKVNPDGSNYTKLCDLTVATGSGEAYGSLVFQGGLLYGMASYGGAGGNGSIVRINPNGTNDTSIHNFNGTDGTSPYGSLISDGTFLYGMAGGGVNGAGTIFKINSNGTNFVKIFDFVSDTAHGTGARGSLFYDGTFLYGMTVAGGANGYGTIFKIKPDGTAYTKLHNFNNTDGSTPYGSLISDGTFLYGMTNAGGVNNKGTMFKIKPNGSSFVKLIDFNGVNGSNPFGSLFYDGSFLYGTTKAGGTYNAGALFKYNLTCAPVTFTQSPVICPGQNYTVGTHTYTANGTYTDLFINGSVGGCDSTVITHLTILAPNTFTQTATICSGQVLTVGTSTYTTAGTYTDVVSSLASGCDSTITTHLYVLSASSSTSNTLSICSGQSVNVGADVYTSTGTFTYTFHGSSCDSVVITNLTVNPTPTTSINGNQGVICNTGTTTLTVSGGGTYVWSTTSTANSIVVSPTVGTTYSVVATLGTCTNTASIYVTPPPITGFKYHVSGAINWQFTDTTKVASGDPITHWSWTFSGGYPTDTSSLQNPGITLVGGNHTICLTTTTQHGCQDVACENVFSSSIAAFTNSSSVNIYPNPAQNNFTVEVSTNEKQTVYVYDVNGKQILAQTINGTTNIDASIFNAGVYNVSITSSQGVVNKRLVIAK